MADAVLSSYPQTQNYGRKAELTRRKQLPKISV
jgi:hypothetical protein